MSSLPLSSPVDNPQHGGGTPITLTIDGKQRTAGFALPNGIWNRRMERSRHFWRTGGEAIGASRAALAEAQRLGCTACKVVDAESGDTYLCAITDYERYGRPVQRPGWGPQIALNLAHWRVIKRDGTQIQPAHERQAEKVTPAASERAASERAAVQMGLWGAD